jgi:CO/xanthine dehydrogenase Mo-binding subunit
MSVRRDLVMGRGRFVADVPAPDALAAFIVRSTEAHARLIAVDGARAAAMPGVRAVLTAADLERERFIPLRVHSRGEMERRRQPVIARDRVRYAGEPVAVVVADDPYLAEDAAERVEVGLDPLPPVTDMLQAGGTSLFDGLGPRVCEFASRHGDVAGAFADAATVVRADFRTGRVTGVPIETRGILARWSGDGALDVWGPTKFLDFTRAALADWFGLELDRVHCRSVNVGGMFGVRGELYPEDFLIPWASRLTGAPVRWIEDRREHFLSINHSREQAHDYELAIAADGELLAFRADATVDLGAYSRPLGGRLPMLVHMMLPGPYDWRAYEIRSVGIATTKTPCGTVRAPVALETTFVRERAIDMAAARLGLDPVAVRRRNLLRSGQMPYTRRLGPDVEDETLDVGDLDAMCEAFLHEIDYAGLNAAAERRRAAGEAVGVGFACSVVHSGTGAEARVELRTGAGRLTVRTTATDIGQGLEVLVQTIVAETLGIAPERVDVVWGSTDDAPSCGGTAASRSAIFLGNAVRDACLALRGRDLDSPGRVEGVFGTQATLGFGLHAAVVSVDRDTLEPTIERLAVAYDVGRAIDMASVRGQLVGAAVHAVGTTLFEQLVYDEFGQLTTTTLMDYLIPTYAETPPVTAVVFEHAAPGNPLGVRGAGEAGVYGVAAVVGSAIAQAMGCPQAGPTSLPIGPETLRGAV